MIGYFGATESFFDPGIFEGILAEYICKKYLQSKVFGYLEAMDFRTLVSSLESEGVRRFIESRKSSSCADLIGNISRSDHAVADGENCSFSYFSSRSSTTVPRLAYNTLHSISAMVCLSRANKRKMVFPSLFFLVVLVAFILGHVNGDVDVFILGLGNVCGALFDILIARRPTNASPRISVRGVATRRWMILGGGESIGFSSADEMRRAFEATSTTSTNISSVFQPFDLGRFANATAGTARHGHYDGEMNCSVHSGTGASGTGASGTCTTSISSSTIGVEDISSTIGVADGASSFPRKNSRTVFVDCTSDAGIPRDLYQTLFASDVAVVTPNKKSVSGEAELFLRNVLGDGNYASRFRFETTVAAGLPIIKTLRRDLIGTGQRVRKIEGMFSGTMGWLFTEFSERWEGGALSRDGSLQGLARAAKELFSNLVAEAQALGLTEPDPQDDLSGEDVARKLLILARLVCLEEAFSHGEFDTMVMAKRLPALSDVAIERVEVSDAFFEAQLGTASSTVSPMPTSRWKYIGEAVFGTAHTEKCDVALRARLVRVGAEHPFFGVVGVNNVVRFETDVYLGGKALVVQGPGAGRLETAVGILSDVLDLGLLK